jgi:hypothetical protein
MSGRSEQDEDCGRQNRLKKLGYRSNFSRRYPAFFSGWKIEAPASFAPPPDHCVDFKLGGVSADFGFERTISEVERSRNALEISISDIFIEFLSIGASSDRSILSTSGFDLCLNRNHLIMMYPNTTAPWGS